jgi:hypothetical protein
MVHWEIDTLACLLREALPFFEKRGRAAGAPDVEWLTPQGRQSEAYMLLDCKRIALECVVEHLNNLVDSILLAIHRRSPDEPDPRQQLHSQGLSRSALTKAIESHHRVTLRCIPGWDLVEQVREQANALKHRGGLTLLARPDLGMNEILTTRYTREEADALMQGVRDWLVRIIAATEGVGRAV